MSPMVAMRTASEMASVETPSSAAMSVIGTTRSSGRSSSAVETTLASSGMRLAWLVSSAAACADGGAVAARDHQLQLALAVVLQEPEADVGHAGEAAADLVAHLVLGELALLLRHQVDDQRGLAHLGARAHAPGRR